MLTETEKKNFMKKQEKLELEISNLKEQSEALKSQIMNHRDQYPEVVLKLERIFLTEDDEMVTHISLLNTNSKNGHFQ